VKEDPIEALRGLNQPFFMPTSHELEESTSGIGRLDLGGSELHPARSSTSIWSENNTERTSKEAKSKIESPQSGSEFESFVFGSQQAREDVKESQVSIYHIRPI
jgi:hypothetical protein